MASGDEDDNQGTGSGSATARDDLDDLFNDDADLADFVRGLDAGGANSGGGDIQDGQQQQQSETMATPPPPAKRKKRKITTMGLGIDEEINPRKMKRPNVKLDEDL